METIDEIREEVKALGARTERLETLVETVLSCIKAGGTTTTATAPADTTPTMEISSEEPAEMTPEDIKKIRSENPQGLRQNSRRMCQGDNKHARLLAEQSRPRRHPSR
jgi:hypothetical protein